LAIFWSDSPADFVIPPAEYSTLSFFFFLIFIHLPPGWQYVGQFLADFIIWNILFYLSSAGGDFMRFARQ
jgi:hypothetical protein